MFQTKFKATIWELKDDSVTTDVTLTCDDQSIKAHKVILSAYSLKVTTLVNVYIRAKTNLKEPVAKFDIDPWHIMWMVTHYIAYLRIAYW